MRGIPSQVIAGSCACAAFAIAVARGMAAGNPADLILQRALIAMVVCFVIGSVIGMICQRVVGGERRDGEVGSGPDSLDVDADAAEAATIG